MNSFVQRDSRGNNPLQQSAEPASHPASAAERWSAWRIGLLSFCFPLLHIIANPYPIYLHPDTTGLVIAGESLAQEGRLLQPFRWDYIFEVTGKTVVSRNQPVVNLDEDARVTGVIYPPGYSWIVAAGKLSGLSASRTCWLTFYVTLWLSCLCWLWWAQRSGVRLSFVCAGLLTLVAIGPATVTDPLGWLAAAAVLLIVTWDFRLSLLVLGTLVIIWADLVRHAAILTGAAWFGLWMTRPIALWQRLAVIVSCGVILLVDGLAKFFRSGGLDPMSLFVGGWPEPVEAGRAVYYAVMGGWSPAGFAMKGLIGIFVGFALVGLMTRARVALRHRWICDLLIVQAATASVLCIAQYKYGADFTKAPVAIARYWRYCTPGLVCAHLFGLGLLIPAAGWRGWRAGRCLQSLYIVLIVVAVTQALLENRDRWSEYVQGTDGFSRKATTAAVHQTLQSRPEPAAVITDNHQLVFTAVNPRRIRCAYYMSGFFSSTGGEIAVVTSGTERGRAVAEACDFSLKLLSAIETAPGVSVRFYDLPPGQVVRFDSSNTAESIPGAPFSDDGSPAPRGAFESE